MSVIIKTSAAASAQHNIDVGGDTSWRHAVINPFPILSTLCSIQSVNINRHQLNQDTPAMD